MRPSLVYEHYEPPAAALNGGFNGLSGVTSARPEHVYTRSTDVCASVTLHDAVEKLSPNGVMLPGWRGPRKYQWEANS